MNREDPSVEAVYTFHKGREAICEQGFEERNNLPRV